MDKNFLDAFVSKVQQKSLQVNQATWILETIGSNDAAALKASLEIELRLLFNDEKIFKQLVAWSQDASLTDNLIKRQLNVLIRMFKPNLIPKTLIEKIAQEEACLSLLYSNFRVSLDGVSLSENDVKEILKNESDPDVRKKIWDASKQIGKLLAPHIIELVHLRNDAAKSLGYKNYFAMQLDLQEVDEEWLFSLLNRVSNESESAYAQLINEINEDAACRFNVPKDAIGPWAWSEPFCQEDPMDAQALDELVNGIDIIEAAKKFYATMEFDVNVVLKRSDNFERPGQSQHAFCLHIDREGESRTLNNVKPTIKWIEVVLHELGHAVYELGFDQKLPWLLKEPPHMITTEAMALLMGRQAYRAKSLSILAPDSSELLKAKAEISLRRRQLIFSRWVLVITHFERELYGNPDQNLNELWWKLVEKFQKIKSSGSSYQCDWAAKYHIGLAPIYYFSYLLGELLASVLEEEMSVLPQNKLSTFFNERLFRPGNSLDWKTLVEEATGKELSPDSWLTFSLVVPKISSPS